MIAGNDPASFAKSEHDECVRIANDPSRHRTDDPLQFRSRIGLLILIQTTVDSRSMIVERIQKTL